MPGGFWGHKDNQAWSLSGGVHSRVDDRPHCRMTAWLPVCPGPRVTRGCGAGLTGRWKSEGGSQGRWHRSSGIPHRKGRVPLAGGRRNTGSEVRKQELSGVQSGWSRGSGRAGGWGCADREDARWRIRNLICGQSGAEGGESTCSSRALAVI
uniref:Uncharacterized protein n=1 Tax=Myotis myotis TaxID=51298 RepID=A0A7J7VIX1_MYOMY|nr:hypothetical protein mMyoMyo1_008386 [Myotis myotis]